MDKNKYEKELDKLTAVVKDIHELSIETCRLYNDAYEDALNGAIGYFTLNGKRFKLTCTQL